MEAQLETSRSSFVVQRLLVIAGAIAAGLFLQQLLGERLAEIAAHAQRDKIAARAELATLIRGTIGTACGLTAALGLWIAIACRDPSAATAFPPPGLVSIAARTVSGPRARTLTRIGFWLGGTLLVASLAAVALAWYAGAVLLACRA